MNTTSRNIVHATNHKNLNLLLLKCSRYLKMHIEYIMYSCRAHSITTVEDTITKNLFLCNKINKRKSLSPCNYGNKDNKALYLAKALFYVLFTTPTSTHTDLVFAIYLE